MGSDNFSEHYIIRLLGACGLVNYHHLVELDYLLCSSVFVKQLKYAAITWQPKKLTLLLFTILILSTWTWWGPAIYTVKSV